VQRIGWQLIEAKCPGRPIFISRFIFLRKKVPKKYMCHHAFCGVKHEQGTRAYFFIRGVQAAYQAAFFHYYKCNIMAHTSEAKKPVAKKAAPAKSSAGSPGSKTSGSTPNSELQKFFVDSIKDIYWAEKHLVKTLPKMEKATSSEELKTAINNHLSETKGHVTRLEQVFELLGEKAQGKKCDAMEGLTKEGESIIEETGEGTATRDVGIIMAAQKVEHYEIATYGGLAQLATTLGHDEISDILSQTLEEEKAADQKLTEVAENNINCEAAEE
jgi:ferritin-like metal-binding protein YciE